MHYNLLYYGYYTSFCNEVNNPVDRKDEYLRTIIEHVRPDVFTVNELGREWIRLHGVYPTYGQLIRIPLKDLMPGVYVVRAFCQKAGLSSATFLVI